MEIKLVALDLDGTLLDSQKRVSQAARASIARLAERGVEFAFATGRTKCEFESISRLLPQVRYALGCNGAYGFDLRENKLIFSDTLSAEIVRALYARAREVGDIMFELFTHAQVLTDANALMRLDDFGLASLSALVHSTRTGVENFSDYIAARKDGVGKVNMFFRNSAERDALKSMFADIDCDKTVQEVANYEFNKLGVNKGSGLKRLTEAMSIDLSQTMAFGDNNNDIPMLKICPNSVAMGNSPDRIKALAKSVAPSNDEDGVAQMLNKLT